MSYKFSDGIVEPSRTHEEKLEHIDTHYRHWLKMSGLKHTQAQRDAFAAGLQCGESNTMQELRSSGYKPADEAPHCVYCDEPMPEVVLAHPKCAEKHHLRCECCGEKVDEFCEDVSDGKWCQIEASIEEIRAAVDWLKMTLGGPHGFLPVDTSDKIECHMMFKPGDPEFNAAITCDYPVGTP